jgi:AmiR/NasT family two-component response regulator
MGGAMEERAPRPARASEPRAADEASLDVIVVAARDESGEALIRELQRACRRVRHAWPAPEPLSADADVLFCDLAPGLPAQLPWLPGEPKAALVALIPSSVPLDLGLLRKAAPDAVLHRPFSAPAVLTSLALARSRFTYERRLRERIERLDTTIRATRSVERAKAILMTAHSLDEHRAYQLLRSRAMERRVSVAALAAAVIEARDLLG